MDKLSRDESVGYQRPVKRPCDVFDMIGGVGTGGLIAILLVVLKMTANDAFNEFRNFVVEVFKDVAPDARKQTEKLTRAISDILERHGVDRDVKLLPSSHTPAPTCKLVAPVMYKNHVGMPCMLRNYSPSYEPPVDLTVAEAMLTTCATPPIFTPISISKDFTTFEYIGADLGLSNPTREIIAEAHRAFGNEAAVSCLLSIGCGHPGVNAIPSDSGGTSWAEFLERVGTNSEKTAQEIETQMSRLPLYHRFSVKYGLERSQVREWKDPNVTTARTTTYLNDLDVIELLDRCVDTLKHNYELSTLEQLKYSGGEEISAPPLPPLNPNYVDRNIPMEFIEKVLFDEDGRIKPGPKRIIVTGIGGCGKTQLIRKLIDKYQNLFETTFFIDGSSPQTIRRDVVRHVRALGGAHSQKSFDGSMLFLSQSLNGGERLLIIDNVDNPTLDLVPFLLRWQSGVMVVTNRNHSRGQLSPSGHLQLDIMTLEESAELLVRGSGQPWPPPENDRKLATSVAEELGCHPIALVRAVSYMYNTGCSPGSYITLLRSHRDRLLRDHPATSQVDMRYKTAFAAFDASYDILPPRARNLWHLLSFFPWKDFPVKLITLAAQAEFSTERRFLPRGDEFELGKKCLKETFYYSGRWDLVELHSILASLRSHSLVTVISVEDSMLLQMHPLPHEWGRLRICEGNLHRFKAAAMRLLCCGEKANNYSMMRFISSYVESRSFPWEGLHVNDAASIAFILAEAGVHGKAATLYGVIHEIVKRQLGTNYSHTIITSANLATAYHSLFRYAEAEKLGTEVLLKQKQLLGLHHPDTITTSANLAATYHELGRYAEAQEMKTKVLWQRNKLLGADHPDTVNAAEHLAITYHELGRHAEAEELTIKILQQRKQSLGADHSDTIKASANLVAIYYELGRYAEAQKLGAEVLRQWTRSLGREHRQTILAKANLAGTYRALKRYDKAEELHTEVLQQRTTLLGERHPDTIQSMLSLALTYKETRSIPEASSLAQRALPIALETLGNGHPLSTKISEFLASLPDEQPAWVHHRDRFTAYMRSLLPP